MRSLRARILLTASLVLAIFLGGAGVLLDRAFRDTALTAVEDRLRGRVFMLLGAADFDADSAAGLLGTLPDPALAMPGSGHYARIVAADGGRTWRSASLLGIDLAPAAMPAPIGIWQFERTSAGSGAALFALGYAIVWEGEGDHEPQRFLVQAFEDARLYEATVAGFRRSLGLWFAGLSVALLLVQGLNLNRGLRPLGAVVEEVRAIERGERELISATYPAELAALTQNLNQLLRHNRASLQRYRNALGDLAHSMKTPLAVLRNAFERSDGGQPAAAEVLEQLERLDRTVQYHLQRAAAAGRTLLTPARPVAPVVDRVIESLRKVHAGRGLDLALELEPDTVFAGDEGDLMEIVGNLADNACKWARTRVVVEAGGRGGRLHLVVRDDGPGIPADQIGRLMQRGARLDESVEGHGIGLAIVRDMVEDVYHGRFSLTSDAAGTVARVEINPA